METKIVGFPRIGKNRELKFAIEKYWKGEINCEELEKVASDLRKENALLQKQNSLSYIPCTDFSFYDAMLDTCILLNVIPACYKNLNFSELDTYFAMARGFQNENVDVKALTMKKWFNTNYHYLVPEFDDETEVCLNSKAFFNKTSEATSVENIKNCVPTVIGPFTFYKLSKFNTQKNFFNSICESYKKLLAECKEKGFEIVQIDEPYLVMDLKNEDITLFEDFYKNILQNKSIKVLLQTYFGDIRDCYQNVLALDFDFIGLDFIEGKENIKLIEKFGFDKNKTLVAGVVNGKNIWKTQFSKALNIVDQLKNFVPNIILSTTCSLLHVPYTIQSETKLKTEVLQYFSFATEKLFELKNLAVLENKNKQERESDKSFIDNELLYKNKKALSDQSVQNRLNSLSEKDFIRPTARETRQKLQRKKFNLPLFPTTTIGSFPQTQEVKHNRSLYKKGEISFAQYEENIKKYICDCVRLQEEIGLDVLVHGEFERNDMVEFFGENLAGFVFTQKGWVQSYGTRCVKPPIIFGDVKREKPMTVNFSSYASSLTKKQVKGMLTGPVTILNWSFPREDISIKDSVFQIALAIKDEVLDLEKSGIKIIQIDEAALREKLPLRKAQWKSDYLDWAIDSFRLCHSTVQDDTQIHTHMCYSEFEDIVKDIDRMDADVITFEASRSKLDILDALKNCNFETECGPGVYDIHSPRVPSVEEIVNAVEKMKEKIATEKLWINPDCGLKTRGNKETIESLKNLVAAAKIVRGE